VLGARPGAGQEQVADLGRGLLVLDELVVLLLDPVDAWALLGLRGLADQLEDLLEVGGVLLGLFAVRFEGVAELLVACLLRELRQLLVERLLGVEHVAELVQEQLAGVGHVGGVRHSFPPVVWAAASCRYQARRAAKPWLPIRVVVAARLLALARLDARMPISSRSHPRCAPGGRVGDVSVRPRSCSGFATRSLSTSVTYCLDAPALSTPGTR
jgi:hypothetical protein